MSDAPPPAPPPAGKTKHWIVLAAACLAVAASFVLRVQPDGDRVALANAPEAKLPPLCFARAVAGIDCPGCGLTRSWVSLAQGDFWLSFRYHRLGWLLFALALAQIPYRLHAIYRPARSRALLVFAGWVGRVLLVLLLANWVGGLFFFPRG